MVSVRHNDIPVNTSDSKVNCDGSGENFEETCPADNNEDTADLLKT